MSTLARLIEKRPRPRLVLRPAFALAEHDARVEAAPDEIVIWRDEVRSFFHPMIGSYINAGLVREIEETLDAYRATH